MKKNFDTHENQEIKEKIKKNLVYTALGSVTMVFGGLISAYIVSMGGAFWLKVPLPSPFFISTAIIIISSLFFALAIKAATKRDKKQLIIHITITFLLGIGFIIFQFKGYKVLVNQGVYAGANSILVKDGRYGDYYTLKYQGKHLVVDGNSYLIDGREVDAKTKNAIQQFGKQLVHADENDGLNDIQNYGSDFVILFESQPLTYLNQTLMLPDGKKLATHDLYRLKMWAMHLRDGRGDFFVKGKYGQDFNIFYKSKKLEYKDRKLYLGDKKLSPYLLNKAMDSADNASSYLYVITFLHLLHIVGTLLFMIKTLIYSYSGRYTNGDTAGLKSTSIFWHYLGILWLILLLFLLFIH